MTVFVLQTLQDGSRRRTGFNNMHNLIGCIPEFRSDFEWVKDFGIPAQNKNCPPIENVLGDTSSS